MNDGSAEQLEGLETRLIRAIEEQRLVDLARVMQGQRDSMGAAEAARVDEVSRCLETLGDDVLEEAGELVSHLRDAGIEVHPTGSTKDELSQDTPMVQVSSITLAINSTDSWAAHSALRSEGFRPWNDLSEAAWEAFRRTTNRSSLVRASPRGYTTQVELSWESGFLERLPAFLLPNPRDFARVNLPKPLWPMYFVVRAVRLLVDRIGRSSPTESLGPFLGTPSSLIGPLLDLADTGPGDTVYDLGCGDGRILIEAARRGCRGTGIELRPDLVERARANATDAGIEHRLEFIEGDVSSVDTADASVIFLFLPATVTAAMVVSLHLEAKPGTRIIAHEQEALPADIGGERHALVTEGGVTIAHRWDVPG